jgi:cytoskeletal protein RodZ
MKMDLKNNKLDETLKGMLSTPKGKGVVAGMVLVIMLLLVLLVVTFAVPQPDDSASLLVNREVAKPLNGVGQNSQLQTPSATSTASATSTISPVNAGTAAETESVKYSDEIMKFRDPFSPIIESTATGGAGYNASSLGASASGAQATQGGSAASAQVDGGSTDVNVPVDGSDAGVDNGSGATTSADISHNIVLTAITREHGVRYGVFQYNGVEFKAQVGETIGNSPYQVLDVGDGSATLLYGDDRLTISLGEEIVK